MMLLPSSVRVFLAAEPCDLRKGFDGLAGLVASRFELEVLDGHLFVFLNKRADQVRILFWDGTGLCHLAKRLERGTFCRSSDAQGSAHVQIASADLLLLLEGVGLRGARRQPRWRSHQEVARAAS
jgi:transposase